MATVETFVQETEQLLAERPVLTITELAASKLQTVLAEKNIPNYGLRVFVAGGGCSGLQYGMAFEQEAREFDQVVDMHGIRLFVDPTSAQYLADASIDYVDSLMGGGFRIDNPSAVSTCGCGHSFRTTGSSEAAGGGHACN